MKYLSAAFLLLMATVQSTKAQSTIFHPSNTSNNSTSQNSAPTRDVRMKYVDVCPPWIRKRVLEEVSASGRDRAEGKLQGNFDKIYRNNLKDVSIRLDEEYRLEPLPQEIVGHGDFHQKRNPITRWFMVTKPNEVNYVAVIAERKFAPALINPTEFFVYGPIPRIENITPKQADQLWGNGIMQNGTSNLERTYKLISKNQHDKIREFFIDLVFRSNKLQKYRVRSSEICCSGWLTNSKEELLD